MERFEAQNISGTQHLSGFGPVEGAENRENEGLGSNSREGLSASKIN
jgi:hypothetical protein